MEKGESMNFESWNVDLETLTAIHPSGAKVVAEGDPVNPDGVHPSCFPEDISAMEQVRLVRCGLEAIAKSARISNKENTRLKQEEKRATARAAHTPTRPVLSLKKKA